MTEDDKTMAKLEERSENQAKDIAKLEVNQRWVVVTLLGLALKAAFDYMTGGR